MPILLPSFSTSFSSLSFLLLQQCCQEREKKVVYVLTPQTISSCMSKCRERKCKKNRSSSLLVVRMNKLQRPINKICLEVNLSKESEIVLKEETGSCYKRNISDRCRLLNASQSIAIFHKHYNFKAIL